MAEVSGLGWGCGHLCELAGVYKDAKVELRELSLRLKTHWYKIEGKISLIKDLDYVLEENLKIHFTELFEMLSRKLEDAKMRLQTIELKQTRLKRIKFTALVKAILEEAITQLDKESTRLDLVSPGSNHESNR